MSTLFEPLQIGDLSLPSRIVMAPLTRRRAAFGKVPTELNATYYAQRASAALIISESTEVDPLAAPDAPTRPGLVNDDQQAGWKLVTDAVHRRRGRIFIQLSHMGRTAHPSQLLGNMLPLAPSPVAAAGTVYTPSGPQPYVQPRALTVPEIGGIVAQFAESARRARLAGFDGIEIHGANGYLIDQFLRDGSNQRTDAYGGSVANRTRILVEIIEAVSQIWPVGRIGVRLSPTNLFQGMSDSDPVAHFSSIGRTLDRFGLAYLHVVEPYVQPAGIPAVAAAIRQTFGGPFILAGGYDRVTAEKAVGERRAHLIAFGEAFIANPDLPVRLKRRADLNVADKATFYSGGSRGYTDYPPLG